MSSIFTKTPEDLVSCWNDDDRMDFLFSAFPADITSKPEHWAAKMDFWIKLVVELFYSASAISVCKADVLSMVTRNGKTPLGFETIWQEMLNQGTIVSSSEYVKNLNMNNTWFGWSINTLLRKPSLWIADKMLSPVKSKQFEGDFISCDAIARKNNDIYKVLIQCDEAYQLEGDNYILPYQLMAKFCACLVQDKKGLDIVLLTLEKEKRISVYNLEQTQGSDSQGMQYIKFSKVSSAAVKPFTEVDQGIAHLHHTMSTLTEEIKALHLKQKHHLQLARNYVLSAQKPLAKGCLRQKQLVKRTIEEKERHLNKLDQILDSIKQSQVDNVLINTYKLAVAAHKSYIEKCGLTPEIVEDTMQDVAEMIETGEEVTSALGKTLSYHPNQDELEAELEKLLEESKVDQVDEVETSLKKLSVVDELPDIHSLPQITNQSVNSELPAS